jgi:hypothetical protein
MAAAHASGLVDVTQGNNAVSFRYGGTTYQVRGYPARPGYDLVTGVGTLDAAAFVPELAALAPYVRTLSFSYNGPCAVAAQLPTESGPAAGECPAGYDISVAPSDRYMTVTIKDSTGSPVPFAWAPSGPAATTNQLVCGSARDLRVSTGTYALEPVLPVGSASCALPPTTGTVTVRLSNYP